MHYEECKVYFDGSHYIAIPQTSRPLKKRPKQPEEIITVVEGLSKKDLEDPNLESSISSLKEQISATKTTKNLDENDIYKIRKLTRKELFDELYIKYINENKKERKQKIMKDMLSFFQNPEDCKLFIESNIQRKQRNLIVRRVRMCRKAHLANFNYFCTFTYDDNKYDEISFKQKLRTCFRHLCERKRWKYMGVWERSPRTNRLHFHGLFNIPNETMPGEIIKVRDYDTVSKKMQESFQSTYFNERFGRSDFKEIANNDKELGKELAYLMKYIEKTGEKIVYSKNLPQFFVSDIIQDDIVCRIGQEDKKLLLFDNFTCIEEGVILGNVNTNIISKMRKIN